MAAWIPAAIGAVGSVVSSLFNSSSQNKNVDKQIAATKSENEKSRAHNLMLAELQNKWNTEQWAKENEYNSPSAQMSRYLAAGLNPDLIYGQSNTSAQLSGSLSSGAPAQPADMSAYGRKQSVVGKALESLDPFMYEQLRGMRLSNDEKEEDVISKRFANDFEAFLREVDPNADFQMISDKSINLMGSLRGRQAILAWKRQQEETQEVSERVKQAVFNNRLNNDAYNFYIKRLRSEAEISEQEARWLMDTFTLRMSGLRSGTNLLQKQDDWFTADKIYSLSTGAINTLIDGYTSLKFGGRASDIWQETYDSQGNVKKVVHTNKK